MKIGILLYDYSLSSSISIINAAILLSEDFEVHIFVDSVTVDKSSKINFIKKNIIVHNIKVNKHNLNDANKIHRIMKSTYSGISNSGLRPYFNNILSKFAAIEYKIDSFVTRDKFPSCQDRVKYYVKSLYPDIYAFSKEVEKHLDDNYAYLIAVHTPALIVSSLINYRSGNAKKIKTIYWNMELLLDSECLSLRSKILKSLERDGCSNSDMIIIQDKSRAEFLMRDNFLPEEKIFFVPVSGLGRAYREKSGYFHEKLGIDKAKKIILYAGNIKDWSMCLEIAQEAQNWKDDKVFVIHTWRTDCIHEEYVKKIEKLTKTKKVFLSLNPVEYDKLPELLSSADIGVIFYKNLGANFMEVGHSSNKLVDYLKVGLPVITIDFPSFKNVINSYNCGMCVKHPRDMEDAVEKIFSDYHYFSNNAITCYTDEYDFNKYFSAVSTKINELRPTSPLCEPYRQVSNLSR
jgi:glycosyltransferase involved in cell wall biosynthesis